MRVLLVRTSSLGDLIHILPAISDIAVHRPQVRLDWVVEQAFVEVAQWHPFVQNVIAVAHRRWRRAWWSRPSRQERAQVIERVQAAQYDLVLDMQALLKSIGWVRAASGVKHGLSWRSAREPLCSLFYDVRHRIEFWQPAVVRQRALAAAAFGYQHQGDPDFGLSQFRPAKAAAQPYAVVMPSASRDDKLWPHDHWQRAFDRLQSAGLQLKLLAGNEQESERASQLITGRDNAMVEPKSTLTQLAQLMGQARIMVGLDSGLTHLSAALGVDTIGIYKASTPTRTPLTGQGYTASLGDRNQQPDASSVVAAIAKALARC